MESLLSRCDDVLDSVQHHLTFARGGAVPVPPGDEQYPSAAATGAATPAAEKHEEQQQQQQHEEEEQHEEPSGKSVLTLLSAEELRAHGLVEAVRSSKDDGDGDGDGDGEDGETESEEAGVYVHELEELRGQDGDFVRIQVSEEEYWALQEAAWEDDDVDELDDDEGGDRDRDRDRDRDHDVDAKSLHEGSELEEEELESLDLRVVRSRGRTGFEPTKELRIFEGLKIAGRYQVQRVVGKAAFSTALLCVDLEVEADEETAPDGPGAPYHPGDEDSRKVSNKAKKNNKLKRKRREEVCCKMVKNSKDFFDQSVDEIRLLRLMRDAGDLDAVHIVRLLDFFYFREHLFIVTELLGDNLFAAAAQVSSAAQVATVARQCLEALAFVHGLGLMHCDIKPENILLRSLEPLQVKLIDFGSSSFTTDRASSYIQSRYYRAPEVVLGMDYDERIDVWSLGCVLGELLAGEALFPALTASTLLAKMAATCGGFPRRMLATGTNAQKFFIKDTLFAKASDEAGAELLYPKKFPLAQRMQGRLDLGQPEDARLLALLSRLLRLDPKRRSSAHEALTNVNTTN